MSWPRPWVTEHSGWPGRDEDGGDVSAGWWPSRPRRRGPWGLVDLILFDEIDQTFDGLPLHGGQYRAVDVGDRATAWGVLA